MTIFIIDSSIEVIERIERLLVEEDSTLTIHKATSITDASTLVGLYTPDVVIIDTNLQANKSLAVLRKIKDADSTTCVICLTINVTPDAREQYTQTGADYFLDKFHEFNKLPGLIEAVRLKKILTNLNNFSNEDLL